MADDEKVNEKSEQQKIRESASNDGAPLAAQQALAAQKLADEEEGVERSGRHRVNTPVLHSGRHFEPGDEIFADDVDGEENLQNLIDAGAVSHEDDFVWPESHWSDNEPNAYDPRPAPDHGPTGTVGFRMLTKVPEPTNVPGAEQMANDQFDRRQSVKAPDHNSTVTRGKRQ